MRIAALALAERALLLDARGHSSYVLRSLLVVLMLLALWVAHELSRLFGAPGLLLFGWVIRTNFVFIAMFGVSTFSAVVSEEKENMTLGLLKMAGFGAGSILVGKSVGQLLTMMLLVLVQLPFALLAITLGGVSQHQILAAYVVLLAHLLFVFGLALLCSVLAPRSGLSARLTGVLLLAYYLLPPLCMWIGRLNSSSQAGSGIGWLYQVGEWLTQNSAWVALGNTTQTGFDAPLLDMPVQVTLVMAAACAILAALAFGPCTRSEAAPAPGRGFFGDLRHRGRNRAISRPRGHPLFWKDFHFLSGGRTGLVLRFVSYGLLLLGIHLLLQQRNVSSHDFGAMTMTITFLALLLDLAIQAGRVFREEINWRTLSTLMILPMPLRSWAYAKIAGCAVIAVPPLFYFGLGAVLAPKAFSDSLGQLMSHTVGWYILALVVLGLHLTVYLSLRLRRAAFAAAILLLFLGNLLLGMMVATMSLGPAGGEACLGILGVMLCLASLAMHPAIARLLAQKAAE